MNRFPQRFLRLLRLSIRDEIISIPTAANLVGLSIDEVSDLVTDKVGLAGESQAELDQFEMTGVPG